MERDRRPTPTLDPAPGRDAPTSRYAKVLVPVADSIDPVLARVAAELAQRLGVAVEVVAVVSHGLEELDAMQLRQEVDALRLPMGVRLLTDDGDVPGALLAAAAAERGLICLGTRGASAVGEALFGSVAAELIRRSRRELVVVGPRCAPQLTGDTLVVAIDGSDGARAIVPPAVELAGALDLRPRLVEVLAGGTTSPGRRRVELARLTDLVRDTEVAPQDDDRVLLHGSRVDETLVAMSAQPEVAMLAMTTHGPGRFERLLGGSVTLDVVRRAACPVIVGPRGDG